MRVVVVGGGFGGVRAALRLANKVGFDVTLVSKQSYFEYHAALYRSATGRSPLEVAIPLSDFFESAGNVEVVKDEIVDIDPDAKTLTGASESVYRFDAVILGLGSVTEYFGIQGLEEYSYGVKTISEALELKRHLHENLVSKATAEKNYVVVGAGASGIELAAELSSYLSKIRRKHRLSSAAYKIELIEAGPQLLPTMPANYSKMVTRRLKKLRVKTYINNKVGAETADGIQLPGGSISSHTVVWTAGVANNPFFKKFPNIFKLGRGGKVEADDQLKVTDGIYIIGDSVDTKYSGMAQTALHDADFVTGNLLRAAAGKQPQPYVPKKPIYAIPVGSNWSAVLWGKLEIYGFAGWVLRRLADLWLYLNFLPPGKALSAWRYGIIQEEICAKCKS